ncbi:MAG: hypothetical protein QOH70_105 [Blastocatellia bacterium]|jgi:hypothetical protein|nr:hypothetical protein [Blastocatellia bacterium]
MAADLTHEEFSRHLNTKFGIRLSEAQAFEAELTEVSEHMISPRQERFSIVFRTANEALINQGVHRFEHETMGPFDLFIVPIQRDETGTYYEAVFNRLIKKAT